MFLQQREEAMHLHVIIPECPPAEELNADGAYPKQGEQVSDEAKCCLLSDNLLAPVPHTR